MELALQRIKKCEQTQSSILDLNYLNLIELPDMKHLTWVKVLECSWNKLKQLDNLPPNLEKLFCTHNFITCLNNLPETLIFLQYF